MSAEAYQRAATVQGVLGERLQKRRFIPEDSLAKLFQSCSLDANRVAGARDAAIMALYFGGGLRRFEALSLFVDDIDPQPEGWLVTVIGKRNQQRSVGEGAVTQRSWEELSGVLGRPIAGS
jgi:site-specific recombinase XerD